MSEETLLEVDEYRDRSTIAATLRSLADQLEEDDDVTLSADAEAVTLALPDHLSYELDVEREDGDEGDAFEIEIELGWEDGAAADVEADRSKATFELYEDAAEEWRWRLVHRNGNVIADSGEGYTTRRNAEKGLRSVMENAPGAEIERVD